MAYGSQVVTRNCVNVTTEEQVRGEVPYTAKVALKIIGIAKGNRIA